MAEIDLNRLSINGIKPSQVIKDDDFIKIRLLEHKIDIVEHLFEEMESYTILGAYGEYPLIIDNINLNLIPIKNIVNIELIYKPAGDVLKKGLKDF